MDWGRIFLGTDFFCFEVEEIKITVILIIIDWILLIIIVIDKKCNKICLNKMLSFVIFMIHFNIVFFLCIRISFLLLQSIFLSKQRIELLRSPHFEVIVSFCFILSLLSCLDSAKKKLCSFFVANFSRLVVFVLFWMLPSLGLQFTLDLLLLFSSCNFLLLFLLNHIFFKIYC